MLYGLHGILLNSCIASCVRKVSSVLVDIYTVLIIITENNLMINRLVCISVKTSIGLKDI